MPRAARIGLLATLLWAAIGGQSTRGQSAWGQSAWEQVPPAVSADESLQPHAENSASVDALSDGSPIFGPPATEFASLEEPSNWDSASFDPEPLGRWWFDPSDIGGYRRRGHVWDSAAGRLRLWGLGRGLFSTDGRIVFTGQETTFAAEGQLLADWIHLSERGWSGLTCETYLTQPFDRNILVDDPLRESYAHNFEIETLRVSQLFATIGCGSWAFDLGRFVTPFGRYYGPLYANSLEDAPLIRSEAIRFRETGAQLRFHGGHWRHAVALTNGSSDRDTNSSKALIARAGFQSGRWAGGLSIKTQDGIGSEGQKEFNSHAGADLSYTLGSWRLAGEWLYDEYGLRRPGLDLNDITWGRSLYNRQLHKGLNDPIQGFGWYGNATRHRGRSTSVIGFGQYFPETLGDRIHDQNLWRILLKQTWQLNPQTEWFVSAFFEESLDNFALGQDRQGYSLLSGFQFHF